MNLSLLMAKREYRMLNISFAEISHKIIRNVTSQNLLVSGEKTTYISRNVFQIFHITREIISPAGPLIHKMSRS